MNEKSIPIRKNLIFYSAVNPTIHNPILLIATFNRLSLVHFDAAITLEIAN